MELALDSIEDGIKQCDIAEEVFSEFTSKQLIRRAPYPVSCTDG